MRIFAWIISIIVILLIVVVLGLPLVMGFIIEKQYPKIVSQLSNPPLFNTKLLSFNRGWFESTARLQTEVKVNLPKFTGPNDSTSVVVYETIKHGPFIFTDNKLLFAKAVILNQTKNDNVAFNSKTIWDFSDKLNSKFASEKFSVGYPNEKLTLTGLKGNVIYKPMAKDSLMKLNLNLNNANFTQQSKTLFELNDLQTNVDYEMENYIWYGTRSVSIGNINITTPENKQIKLEGISCSAQQSKQNDTTQINLKYSTKKLVSDDIDLSDIDFALNIMGLNTQALSQLISQSNKLQEQPDSKTPQQVMSLYNPFLDLVSKGFVIQLERFFMQTQNGPVDIIGKVTFPPQPGTVDIKSLTQKIIASAEIKIPREWLQKMLADFHKKNNPTFKPKQISDDTNANPSDSPQQNTDNTNNPNTDNAAKQPTTPPQDDATAQANNLINEWLSKGWITQEGNMIKTILQYSNGRLLINGKLYNPDNTNSTTPKTPNNTPSNTPNNKPNTQSDDQSALLNPPSLPKTAIH